MADVPEQYFYSSLEAEEIEDRLLHMVPYNHTVELTAEEKALFRKNIGAGQTDSGFVLKGYFVDLEELQAYLTAEGITPEPGDAYGLGEEAPYHIYVYDGYHDRWVDNGTMAPPDVNAFLADDQINKAKSWSSSKITSELDKKQNVLTFDEEPTAGSNRIVTSGVVHEALRTKEMFSPIERISPGGTRAITLDDIDGRGKTFIDTYSSSASQLTVTISFGQEVSTDFPIGYEMAFINSYSKVMQIVFTGIRFFNVNEGELGSATGTATVGILQKGMAAIKKIESNSSTYGDVWLLTGNVEVIL